jgi:hypothetical protein
MVLYGGRLKLWDISRAYRHVERFFRYDRESNCVSYRISDPALGFRHRRRMPKPAAMLCLMLTFTVRAAEPPGAWTGPYSPCPVLYVKPGTENGVCACYELLGQRSRHELARGG